MRGERFGTSVQFIGDLDRDGVAEIAIGDDECTWILSGKTHLIVDRIDTRRPIVDLGDVNGDGVHDLACFIKTPPDAEPPAPSSHSPVSSWRPGIKWTFPRRARVRVLDGVDRRTLRSFDVEEGGWCALCSGGDFDHDGRNDLVFLTMDPECETYWPRSIEVRSGTTGKRIAVFPARADGSPRSDGNWLDEKLHVIQDIDGDGLPEILVVSRPLRWFEDPWRLRCISGAAGVVIWDRIFERGEFEVGSTIIVAADADGNGLLDVLLNAPAFDGPDSNNNRPIRVLSSLHGTDIDRFISSESGAVETQRVFGTGIAIVRGAQSKEGSELWCGSVSTNFLASTGMLEVTCADHHFEPVPIPDDVPYGTVLASGADVDGDGVDDVLVSGFEWFGGVAGRVLLISGGSRTVIDRFRPEDLDRVWEQRRFERHSKGS